MLSEKATSMKNLFSADLKSAEITYGFYNKATTISDYESMFYSKYNTKK
jgi:hypothetical protein